eukprot:15477560-Alexandrium_andersonii.AAC.1
MVVGIGVWLVVACDPSAVSIAARRWSEDGVGVVTSMGHVDGAVCDAVGMAGASAGGPNVGVAADGAAAARTARL